MRKRWLLAVLTVLLLCLCSAGLAEPAPEVTKQCTFRVGDKVNKAKKMLDRDYETYFALPKGKELSMEAGGKTLGGVYLQHYERAADVLVQVKQDGEWVDAGVGGAHMSDWFPFPAGVTEARICNTDKKRVFIAELTVFGAGEKPADVPQWRDADKADMMLLVAHPDDELLWFGGLLPTYAGERGLTVQVVYAVSSTPVRKLELLDGLWHCGVRDYPAFLGLRDVFSGTLQKQYKMWNHTHLQDKIVELLRRYRPDVLVTQDLQGEYGHGGHKAVSDSATQAVEMAADGKKFPETAKEFGTWEVQKFYIHLYKDGAVTRMNWHAPLTAFDGRDGLTVATEALACHKSQTKRGWEMTDGGEMDNAVFGLYATRVGADEACDDLMEHIASAK